MHWPTNDGGRLGAGEKIESPLRKHPSKFGFRRLWLAEQVGQVEDWALSMSDGSRLHVWLMRDGRWIMHRDAIDPARGPIEAVAHLVTESRIGKVLVLAALVAGVGAIAHRASA